MTRFLTFTTVRLAPRFIIDDDFYIFFSPIKDRRDSDFVTDYVVSSWFCAFITCKAIDSRKRLVFILVGGWDCKIFRFLDEC